MHTSYTSLSNVNVQNKRHSQTNIVIYNKSQSNVGVATRSRCGEIFNSHILTSLLLSLPVETFLIGEYLVKLQEKFIAESAS